MSMPEESDELLKTQPVAGDQRIALCLSGGGFRASLFHLGALRRLNELGILSKVDMIASVSGGSILAAHLATVLPSWPSAGTSFDQWQEQVEAPFQTFVQKNLRTGPLLRRFLLPWNWFRPSTQVKALEGCYRARLTHLSLPELMDRPTFVFCGTDMVHGVSWVFERRRVGSYQSGYLIPAPSWPVAKAVAASSCFPPVFSPMPMETPGGRSVMSGVAKTALRWEGMSVSDGGLYDNLGLQPAARHGIVLASDGGQPFVAAVPKGLFGRAKAYLSISGKQAGALRRQFLIGQFNTKQRQGTYWGIGSAVDRYRRDASPGYSKAFAANVIARIRTDLDAFSEAEIAVLMNHGYLLADIAVNVHAPQLIAHATEKRIPFSDWMDEGKAGAALRHSDERWNLGRF
jgi:NTE family protein